MTQYAVSALKAKRAEMAGQVEAMRSDLARLQDDLSAVDRTLIIFGYRDLSLISAKVKRNTVVGRGFQRLVLGFLREHPGGLTTQELADKVIEAKGLASDARPAVMRSLNAKLNRLRERDMAVAGEMRGAARVWHPTR